MVRVPSPPPMGWAGLVWIVVPAVKCTHARHSTPAGPCSYRGVRALGGRRAANVSRRDAGWCSDRDSLRKSLDGGCARGNQECKHEPRKAACMTAELARLLAGMHIAMHMAMHMAELARLLADLHVAALACTW